MLPLTQILIHSFFIYFIFIIFSIIIIIFFFHHFFLSFSVNKIKIKGLKNRLWHIVTSKPATHGKADIPVTPTCMELRSLTELRARITYTPMINDSILFFSRVPWIIQRPQSLFFAGSWQENASPLYLFKGGRMNIKDPDLSFNRLPMKSPT